MVVAAQKRDSEGRWKTAPHARQADRWRARFYYRGYDGILRSVDGFGRKRAEAEAACVLKLEARLRAYGSHFTRSTSFISVGRAWLDHIKRPGSGKSARTIGDYEGSFDRHVDVKNSLIGGLSLEQVNKAQTIRLFLEDVADRNGTGSAKTVKSVVSNVLGFGVDNGVLESNACRSVRPAKSRTTSLSERDTGRAFTEDELRAVFECARKQARADTANPRTLRMRQAVADMIEFMAGTGVRIGEARSLRWPDLDLEARRVTIRGTKTKNAMRILNLSTSLTKALDVRAEREGATGYVFSSPGSSDTETPWDQSNNAQAMRTVFDEAGFPWATPHTLRRTVASRLHASGIELVRIADQLGHADPAMTMSVYLGRDFSGDKADLAEMLDLKVETTPKDT